MADGATSPDNNTLKYVVDQLNKGILYELTYLSVDTDTYVGCSRPFVGTNRVILIREFLIHDN